MESNAQMEGTQPGQCCDTCGDVGYPETLCICSKCNAALEHIYCMRNNCMEVPEVWICETCTAAQSTVPCKLSDGMERPVIRRPKYFQNSKVKYIPLEDVIKLPNKADLGSSHGKNKGIPRAIRSKSPQKTTALSRELKGAPICKEQIESPRHISSSSVEKCKTADGALPTSPSSSKFSPIKKPGAITIPPKRIIFKEQVKSPRSPRLWIERFHSAVALATPPSSSKQCLIEKSEGVLQHSPRNTAPKEQIQSPRQQSRFFRSNANPVKKEDDAPTASPLSSKYPCGRFHEGAQPKKSTVDAEDLAIVCFEPVKDFPYFPAKDPIWKGSFDIVNDSTFGHSLDVLHAHPASRIHRKAYEFSKRMPAVLQFKLLPRCKLGSEMFQEYCLVWEDIALYFFPRSFRSRRSYINLLKMIEDKDLVMTSSMGYVESLVFSSDQLRMGKWGTGTDEHFMWGIFRHTLMRPDVDMEMDMAGGRMDAVVPWKEV